MIDLHPPISGLPLASVLLLLASEALALVPRFRGSQEIVRITAVVCCVVSVAAAFLSGYQASSQAGALVRTAEDAMSQHHSLGRLLLINSLLLATFFLLRRYAVRGKRILTALYYVTFFIQVTLTVWVGYLGGQLVFSHGVNVRVSGNP
jgi:uncharacterized membrane protein